MAVASVSNVHRGPRPSLGPWARGHAQRPATWASALPLREFFKRPLINR